MQMDEWILSFEIDAVISHCMHELTIYSIMCHANKNHCFS